MGLVIPGEVKAGATCRRWRGGDRPFGAVTEQGRAEFGRLRR